MSKQGFVNCPDCGTTFNQYESACPKCGCPEIYAEIKWKSKTRCRIIAAILCILGCVCLYRGYAVICDEHYKQDIESYEKCIQGYMDAVSASNDPINSMFRAEYQYIADGYADLINSSFDDIWSYRMDAIYSGMIGLMLFIGAGFVVYKKRPEIIMVRCRNCQTPVSDRADQCPECGEKRTPARMLSGFSYIKEKIILYSVTVVVIGIVAFTGASIGMNNEKNGIMEILSKRGADNVEMDYSYQYAFDASDDTALDEAVSYLSIMPFSYHGLIDQLEYGGFSHDEAVDAVDRCGADWNEQAVKAAQSYLNTTAFSYDGLISQLEYEQFTKSQAKYGADYCGADWNKQAVKMAERYLELFPDWTKSELRKQLIYEGFTSSEAEYGVNYCVR